jgi:signal peptidase II
MTAGSLVGLIIVGGGFFCLDQWSKRLAQDRLRARSVDVGSVLRLRLSRHVEHSYGQRSSRGVLVVVWGLALASAIVLLRFVAWFQNPAAGAGLAFALGGAAGNLADILRRRCIINFIDLRWWPIFNVADAGIVGGLIIAFLAHH